LKSRSGEVLSFWARFFLGSDSVQWWPRGNKANKFQKSWAGFAALLDDGMSTSADLHLFRRFWR